MKILPLIDAFASASLDGTLWQTSLAKLADATGSARGQLVGIGGPKTEVFNFMTATTASDLARFDEIASYDPAINFRTAAAMKAVPMSIVAEAEYDRAIAGLTDDVYRELCYETDTQFGCQTTLLQGDDGLVGLSMLRSRADGRSSEDQRTIFAAIAPHVRSAVRIQRALESDGAKLIVGAMEAVCAAVFVCDARGRVHAYSTTAERLLRTGSLSLSADRLKTRFRRDGDALNRALHALSTQSVDQPAESVVSVVLMNGGDPLILDVVALPNRSWNLGFQPRMLVIARQHGKDVTRAAMLLRAAYGVSEAEAHVALGYAQGKSRDRIAQDRGVSVHTIRVQTKSLFGKMAVNRETALAALVAKFL